MKKLFALTLAAAMVLSMASVAFAASPKYLLDVYDDDDIFKIDDHQIYYIGEDEPAIYGDTLYILVECDKFMEDDMAPYALINENGASFSDMVKNYKIKADWSKNGDLIEGVEFTKVLVDVDSEEYKNIETRSDRQIAYAIAIDTKKMPEATKSKDVIGTITIDPKSKNLVNCLGYVDPEEIIPGEEYKFDVAFTLNYKDADEYNVGYDATADDDYVYDFSKAGEDEEYELELFAGMGRFEVNTYGQGKLAINTNVEYNEGIENVSPDANYVYFNSNNATFNRLGDLYLTADEDNYIYKVKGDGSLEKISPKYDEDEEAFVIRTRVIGSYVIAEEELPENALTANVEKEEAPVAPVAPANPATGAAC